MSNVINWQEWNIPLQRFETHTATNQPELDVTYNINGVNLSEFTSLFNTGLSEDTPLPERSVGSANGPQHEYTTNAGYIWPYVFRRNTSNRHFFKRPNATVNKIKIKWNATDALKTLSAFGGIHTLQSFIESNDSIIFKTDTLEARMVNYSIYGDAPRPYGMLDERVDPDTGHMVKYWKPESDGIFWNSITIRVKDLINDNYKEFTMAARTLPYGYSVTYNPRVYVTFIVLNDFNPKYSYDDGYIYNTKVIQKYNDEYRYDNQKGKFIYPIFGFFNDVWITTLNSSDIHVQMYGTHGISSESPYDYLLERIFAEIDTSTGRAINRWGDITLYNDWETPQLNVTVTGDYVVDNCTDMYLDYYYVPVSYNNDSGSYEYYISGCTLGEIPPVPDPDPEDFDPDVKYPDEPDNVQNLPTPHTPQDTTGLEEYLKGYKDGQVGNSNYQTEEATNSDSIDGLNGDTSVIQINAKRSFDYDCYALTYAQVGSMRNDIDSMVGCNWVKVLLALDSSYSAANVIDRVIELPFSPTYLGSIINTIQSSPRYGAAALCREPVRVTDTAKHKQLINNSAGVSNVVDLAYETIGESVTLPANIRHPFKGTIKYYTRLLSRYAEVDYGSKTLTRIFGSFLDFTDVNYKLVLPQGESYILDPNLLFRDSNGGYTNTAVISIKGFIDLQTGDMLINVTCNNEYIIQTTINMAVERKLNGKDSAAEVRNVATAIKDAASLGLMMAGSPSIVGTNTHTLGANAPAKSYEWGKKANGNTNYRTGYDPNHIFTGLSGSSGNVEYNSISAQGIANGIFDTLGATGNAAIGARSVDYTAAVNNGSTKLIANQLPYIVYDYPEIMIPSQGPYSYPGPWDFTFNYFTERGLPAATTKIGKGYNQYGLVTNVDLNWTYSWSHNEIQGFKEDLIKGFHIYNESNIYRNPRDIYSEIFQNPSRYKYSTEEPGYVEEETSQGYEHTDTIVLVNVVSNWEKYIDRFCSNNIVYSLQGGFNIAYECTPYRDMNIDTPVVDISSEVFTHQNTAIWNGRIYRVTSVDYMPGHIVRLYLQEDYITTWFYFSVVEGIITRSTSYGISDMMDQYPRTVKRKVKKVVYDSMRANLGSSYVVQSSTGHSDAPSSNQNTEEE